MSMNKKRRSVKKNEKPSIRATKESQAAQDVFDAAEPTTYETDDVELLTEEHRDEHESEYHESALGPISSEEVLSLWRTRGIHYRAAFMRIIVDVLASVNALSDIEQHFKQERIDPSADYVTRALLDDFEIVVLDKLVHELISGLFEDDAEGAKRVHAYLLAMKMSRRPTTESQFLGLKKLIEETQTGNGQQEELFGNLGARKSYGDRE